MPEKTYKLSVHGLVDFLLRKGDIDNRVYNQDTMTEGTKIHGFYQKKQGKEYISEYYLKEEFVRPLGKVTLDGRADGIIVKNEIPTIDEIKSTIDDLQKFYERQKEWHLGQAKCYALMYAHEKTLDRIKIKLTYISQYNRDTLIKEFEYKIDELEKYVNDLLDEYLEFFENEGIRKEKRNKTSVDLNFPFAEMRGGQRAMSKYIYSVANNGGIFFCEAPTGIGKTMSALFPSIKAFGTEKIEKIFYLTAKTTGRESAFNSMGILYANGLRCRDSLLTAKEKICLKPDASCNPDECPYAYAYYDKIRKVISEALASDDRFSPDYVTSLAKHHAICPFELQLDLSLYSDVIICDYNYLFDPMVHLERFFDLNQDIGKYFALIDEAHNLLERGREMYSSTISLKDLSAAKSSFKGKKNSAIYKSLSFIESIFMTELSAESNEEELPNKVVEMLMDAIVSLDNATKRYLKKKGRSLPLSIKDFSRECHRFSFLNCNYNEKAKILYLDDEKSVKLFCYDPAEYLRNSLKDLMGAALFSATLSPMDYYQESLLGDNDFASIALNSPFPKENFNLMISPISTRYRDRIFTMGEIAKIITAYVSTKIGNYFIYLPSYEYLDKFENYFQIEGCDIRKQDKEMTDQQKKEFLAYFKPNPTRTTVGLLVIGGAFSEGINLANDRLIGVAIVGIGLPRVCKEKEVLRKYYDEKNNKGFVYSYLNPGMNKVMQAIGRVIRSPEDIGSALLIDDRYLKSEYRDLLKGTWSRYHVVTSQEDVINSMKSFFKNKD